ncbi:MAG: hypothetical protein AB1552_12740 [Nitrospirota bacterium]
MVNRRDKKKVVYLFGAGATHAVLKSISPTLSLLTKDIQERMARNHRKYPSKRLSDKIWSELITVQDIEHLISVLESQHHYFASEIIREYYRNAIVDIIRSSPELKKLPAKNLYTVLIDLHNNVNSFDEELLCFITLNYEDILERTIKAPLGFAIDYSLHLDTSRPRTKAIKILKLHGSFNWQNTRPVTVKSMTATKSSDSLWIPPGVEKKKDNYPFNLLWGQASEILMRCDILRIIGCSLSRNDWGLIPILYTVQRFNHTGKMIKIEIIDYPSVATAITHNYEYLDFQSLIDMPEILYYYKKFFPSASPGELIAEITAKFLDKDKTNPFQEWLDAKIGYLIDRFKLDIKTPPQNIVHNFYYKT